MRLLEKNTELWAYATFFRLYFYGKHIFSDKIGEKMLLKKQETISCDVLIIGSGGAGLRAAIAATEKGCDVLIMSKARIGHASNTYLSKAIIASSGWGQSCDNGSIHSDDTLKGGRHLNNPDMVASFTKAIREETALLKAWGMDYTVDKKSKPTVLKMPGHSYARHLTGRHFQGSDLVIPLKNKAKKSGVRFQEKTFASSLLISGNRVCGATGIDESGNFLAIKSRAVIIATGGFGQLFLNTNNAPGITGDGHVLALKAGVSLQDMEFVQFYPTAYGKRGSRILLYEQILVQKGAVLKNSINHDILAVNGYSPTSITRDELAQVIMKEILAGPEQRGSVYMDLTALSDDSAQTVSTLLPAGWFKGDKVFEVTPTTHFCMGGIVTDTEGRTSCPGLFAAGEVVAGSHGANRLAGNALAEIIAMGGITGRSAASSSTSLSSTSEIDELADNEKQRLTAVITQSGSQHREVIQKLKEIMWFNAGILRDQHSLETALKAIMGWKDIKVSVTTPRDLIRFLEFKNLRLVSEAVCRSALERTETRGAHFRSDYPEENDREWLKNIRAWQTDTGIMIEHIPVPGTE